MSYQGLVNEGATCYLNSLLQTLCMTPEFRQNVYAYQHDPKKISQKDSIPYQLQKLFVNLQTKNKACYTKSLLRSFQWDNEEAFQQHDVQQFCRKLFQAIEKTHKNTGWIKELFQGSMQSYVYCGQHRSNRSQAYMDIALPIRNQYTKQTYQSIEQSLYDYLKPQKLEDKFECSGCGQRVFVQKGMALQSIPPILTLQLNRFQLNFETFQREKINSFFYFPQILEMHRFMKPHGQIEIKGLPKNLMAKTIIVNKKQTARTANIFDLKADKPRERKKSDDKIGKKEVVTYFDQQNKDKRKQAEKQFSKQDQKLKNLEILASLKSEKGKIDEKMEKIKEKDQYDLDNDMLFGMGAGFLTAKDWQTPGTVGSFERKDQPTFEKADTNYEHEEESFDPTKQYPPLTYALYAVLVHSGGSYGGHYFAYISDGVNWYKFDDSTVTKVKKSQIRKYGVNTNATNGTNAYLLFYRDVKTFKQLNNLQIPIQLLEKVKLDEQKVQQIQQTSSTPSNDRYKRLNEISQGLIVKVFNESKSEPLVLNVYDRNEETVNSLRQKIKNWCNITEKDENWRLRRYNKTDDSIYQVYPASQTTLEQLGLREQAYMTVQFKKDEQIFEQFNPRKITVKINVWRPDIIMIVEKKLKPARINILDEASFEEFYNAVVKATGLRNPLVIRRNFSGSNPINKLELEVNRNKKLIDLRFFNNIVLYVEERDESPKTKWELEFQNERFRCLIKYNNPKNGEVKDEQIYFDTRRTLGELKAHLSSLISIPEDNFRIKKGKQATAQMTTYKKKLTDLRFIGNETLYLQQGKSSKGSIIVKRGEVGIIEDRIQFSLFEELQFQIGADLVTVGDLAKKISQITGIPHQNIRIRQYRSFQFKEIFSPGDQIQRIRDKSLLWELVEGDLPKGMQIYYRIFNIMTFQFGPLKSLYADTSSSYEELCLLIEQETGIAHNKILAWRPLSNYIQKENMLDVEWKEIRYITARIREEPLLINCDGDILIIKEAQKAYEAPKVKRVPESKKNKGEAQLTITVIAENEEPAAETTQPKVQSQTASVEEKKQAIV